MTQAIMAQPYPVAPLQDLGRVYDYYCRPRRVGERTMSVYDIWEEGGALDDSITPSTYCQEYRSHVVMKMLSLTQEGDRIFSIGCGNAFVEADLARLGRPVQAIDCNEDAVRLASAKGVDAFTADFYALPPGCLESFAVIYADGLLGHLYRSDAGLKPFFTKLASLRPRPGTWVVFSNDGPRDRTAMVAPHERVEDFWFLSRSYLAGVLEAHGFANRESYSFPYVRPLSGMRERTICVARMGAPPSSEA